MVPRPLKVTGAWLCVSARVRVNLAYCISRYRAGEERRPLVRGANTDKPNPNSAIHIKVQPCPSLFSILVCGLHHDARGGPDILIQFASISQIGRIVGGAEISVGIGASEQAATITPRSTETWARACRKR